MKNTAAKGRRNEHKSRAMLEADGFTVIRSAASKGPFDLIGIRHDGIILVQCKSNRWPDPEERLALEMFMVPRNCIKVIHRWDNRAKEPRVWTLGTASMLS